VIAVRGSIQQVLIYSQEKALRELLSDPQQKLVSLTGSGQGASVGFNGATVRPDGYALIIFSGGPLLLDPKGNVILRTGGESIPVVNPVACAATAVEGILSIGLAVLLMITGVRLMHSPDVPMRSIRVYALSKTIVAVAGGAAAGWMTASLLVLPTLTRSPSPDAAAYGAAVGAAFAVIGCAFPIAMEIASHSRQVREYRALFE
jgi:hypothetical protein